MLNMGLSDCGLKWSSSNSEVTCPQVSRCRQYTQRKSNSSRSHGRYEPPRMRAVQNYATLWSSMNGPPSRIAAETRAGNAGSR